MAWISKAQKPCEHNFPSIALGESYLKGSVWECDQCRQRFRFDGFDGDQRDTWPKWTLIAVTPPTGSNSVSGPAHDRPSPPRLGYVGPYGDPRNYRDR